MSRMGMEDGDAARELAKLLRGRHDEILEQWKARVLQHLPGARGLPEPLLRNEVADLLRELAAHLEEAAHGESAPARARGEARAAAVHGVERLRAGFDIEEVVAEYNLLRALIFEAATEAATKVALSQAAIAVVNEVVDRSVATAVKTYARQHALEERRRRSEHIAFVTHEMRNPLATLGAVTEVLRTSADPPAPRVTEMLQQSVTRLDKLIRELIDESRQIGGELAQKSHPKVMKLFPLAGSIVKDLEQAASQAGIALGNEVPAELEVCADPNMLDIALANLVKNAIDHSGARRLVIGARPEGADVVCWVEDDGRGLPPEQRAVIFEPYAGRSDGGGCGLGLYIAKRFTEAMAGNIAVHSEGGGVRFEVTLPACAKR